jgi:hypothetical protein
MGYYIYSIYLLALPKIHFERCNIKFIETTHDDRYTYIAIVSVFGAKGGKYSFKCMVIGNGM